MLTELLCLGHAIFVEISTLEREHERAEAPEDLFFVSDIEQQKGGNLTHALCVTDFSIVVSIRHQHIEQTIVAALIILLPQPQLAHRSVHILLDDTFILLIFLGAQLGVEITLVVRSE